MPDSSVQEAAALIGPDTSTTWPRTWLLQLATQAAACLFLYSIGGAGYDLLTDDEIRYAEAGRCMVESGDWVIPQFNGYPRYQKPILYYWLQALAQLAF